MVPSTTEQGLPAGYPEHLVGPFELRDGRTVWIRPILPTDATEIAEAIEAADRETLLHRFFTGAPHITTRQIHYLAEVDYQRRLALIARSDDDRGVAIARYECHPQSSTAEVAVVVAPEWRGQGLATELLRRLEEPAVENGFDSFDAVYLPNNYAVAHVFRALAYSPARIEDGIARVSKKLAT
jgi:RimJ/RimL family protein N-acetyltransferase